jgi:electron transfer flavoprotein alpha subunit
MPDAPQFALPRGTTAATKTITTAAEAADYLQAFAARARSAQAKAYTGVLSRGRLGDNNAVWAILDPREQKANAALLCAAGQLASVFKTPAQAVVPAPRGLWPELLGLAKSNGANLAFCIDTGKDMLSLEGKRELLRLLLKASAEPVMVAGTYWTEAFGLAAGEASKENRHAEIFGSVSAITPLGNKDIVISRSAYDNRLVRTERLTRWPAFLTVPQEAEFAAVAVQGAFEVVELEYPLELKWLMPLPAETVLTLAQAEVIIALGYGIKDRAGLALAEELKKLLEAMGLAPMFGATRKVTQDLKLLPLEAQIGQTGVRVNPRLIISLGISGAPQHIDYLGTRAEILCFNKDADAPLMKLNQTRPAPRVHPIAGDLFATVKELIERLG